jgi:hypothetical protein
LRTNSRGKVALDGFLATVAPEGDLGRSAGPRRANRLRTSGRGLTRVGGEPGASPLRRFGVGALSGVAPRRGLDSGGSALGLEVGWVAS